MLDRSPTRTSKYPTPGRLKSCPRSSTTELVHLFSVTSNARHLAVLVRAYAAGIRASEICRLQVSDIDFRRKCLCFVQGNGRKDRNVPLSQRLLVQMRDY